jgi:RNA polymerase sigma factor (TIGR02999 family)
MSDVHTPINSMRPGAPAASAELRPLMYDDLRRLATCRLSRESRGQMLEPTALIHEAYLRRVADAGAAPWDNRGHFFAAAAEAKRRILVENARRKHTLKRGGALVRRRVDEDELRAPEPREDVLAVDEALTQLAATDRAAPDLVHLRYFGSLTIPEAAEVLGVSPRTADRLWTYARAWLRDRVSCGGPAAAE